MGCTGEHSGPVVLCTEVGCVLRRVRAVPCGTPTGTSYVKELACCVNVLGSSWHAAYAAYYVRQQTLILCMWEGLLAVSCVLFPLSQSPKEKDECRMRHSLRVIIMVRG